VIASFTAVFSLCLNLITTATVKDIFQATATQVQSSVYFKESGANFYDRFAAVLVVFVGTTEPSRPN